MEVLRMLGVSIVLLGLLTSVALSLPVYETEVRFRRESPVTDQPTEYGASSDQVYSQEQQGQQQEMYRAGELPPLALPMLDGHTDGHMDPQAVQDGSNEPMALPMYGQDMSGHGYETSYQDPQPSDVPADVYSSEQAQNNADMPVALPMTSDLNSEAPVALPQKAGKFIRVSTKLLLSNSLQISFNCHISHPDKIFYHMHI